MMAREAILAHFNRRGSTRDDLLQQAAYPLVNMIVQERGLEDVGSLMRFVNEPENLRPWLPSRNDRVILSGTIREGLQELSAPAPQHRQPSPRKDPNFWAERERCYA